MTERRHPGGPLGDVTSDDFKEAAKNPTPTEDEAAEWTRLAISIGQALDSILAAVDRLRRNRSGVTAAYWHSLSTLSRIDTELWDLIDAVEDGVRRTR